MATVATATTDGHYEGFVMGSGLSLILERMYLPPLRPGSTSARSHAARTGIDVVHALAQGLQVTFNLVNVRVNLPDLVPRLPGHSAVCFPRRVCNQIIAQALKVGAMSSQAVFLSPQYTKLIPYLAIPVGPIHRGGLAQGSFEPVNYLRSKRATRSLGDLLKAVLQLRRQPQIGLHVVGTHAAIM